MDLYMNDALYWNEFCVFEVKVLAPNPMLGPFLYQHTMHYIIGRNGWTQHWILKVEQILVPIERT